MSQQLTDFLQNYMKKGSLFKDKKALQSNYKPKSVPYRGDQINQIAAILAPSLRMEKPSNLFIYGKTGCITGDSLVYTSDGYVPIKDINKHSLVLSFNLKTKQYEWSPFIFLRFHNTSKLLKIKLSNGLSLTVTKDHPLLTTQMDWKKADAFSIGDELVIGYDLPSLNEREIPLAKARLLGFIISDGSSNRRQRRTIDSKGYYYNSDRQRLRYFSDDFQLLKKVQKDLQTLYTYTPSIIQDKNRCPAVQVISQEICQDLHQFGIPFGSKSSLVQIPSVIFTSSPIIQREFLKALFSGDGTVSRQTYQIEYYSNSKQLLQGISCLLHQEGILCTIKPKPARCNGKQFNSYGLYIQKQENLTKFYHKIGFYSQYKQQRLKALLNKYQKQMNLKQESYTVSKIASIKETYEPYVYDLTVPKNHNFIANGIISHNTGKTLVTKHVTDNILHLAAKNKINLKVFYLNCKLKRIADTEYRLVAQLAREFGEEVPATGLPTDEVYKVFLERLEREKVVLLIILDEIDQLVHKTGDGIMYNLTRLNSELKHSEISLIGISNDLMFTDAIDPRVKSSLSEEELVFPPYNAIQLQKILKQRAKLAFHPHVLKEGVLEKCAAYAAREHGDARRALELLRVSGELAERKGETTIAVTFIDQAEEKIERDRVIDIVTTQPKQFKITLHSILTVCKSEKNQQIFTGDVYDVYKQTCQVCGITPLTQRRLSDIIAELDMLGIINAKVISKGRYGRMREISLAIPHSNIPQITTLLQDSLHL